MNPPSRRICLRGLVLMTLPGGLRGAADAIAGIDDAHPPAASQQREIAALARKFLDEFEVPGLSVAFAHRERIVHRAGFGFADAEAGTPVTPDHLFRIASVSKPLTSAAVFVLIERGKLALDDKVFGATGILAGFHGKTVPERVREITVRHLLTHTCGGWQNDRDDPMFRHPELNHRELIARTLRDQALRHAPGKRYAYSNFGYCLLGRIIERRGDMGYESFIRKNILKPCGSEGMKIAGNTLADRAPGEVIYDRKSGDPYTMNVRRMDSHGGWIASPADLVNFLVRHDGRNSTPDLLKQASLETMFTASPANDGYACGWSVNKTPNRWHGGSLPGTTAIAVTTASGMSWAGLANSRRPGTGPALDQLMWRMARAVPEWKA